VNDEYFMHKAICQARLGLGQTSPNPAVGAVIVHKGEIIAHGFHARSGTPHAERVVIAKAEEKGFREWSEATLYVTLEPCSTEGRTGACTTAIIGKSFQRVVYGAVDPNPDHIGQADKVLIDAGVKVTSQVLEKECNKLIRGFSKVQREGMPWIIIKSAMSLDGKITRPPSEGQWLTTEESRHEVHKLRARVDAIITGGNTVRIDDPSLTVRLPDRDLNLRQPKRVIFTQDLKKLPDESELLQDTKTLIFEINEDNDLINAFRALVEEHGVNSVLVEAGGRLLGALNDICLIDEVVMFYASMITGGGSQALEGKGVSELTRSMKLDEVVFTKIGNDLMMQGIVKS